MKTKITTILGIIIGMLIIFLNLKTPELMMLGILLSLGSLFMFVGTFFVPKKV